MSATELRQRAATPYSPYADHESEDADPDAKGHPAPAKQVGMGMLIGMAIAAVFIIGFVVYIEEEKWKPDYELHAKVKAHHKKHKESHAHLTKLLHETRKKVETGEIKPHKPTPEELESARIHEMLRDMNNDHLHGEVEAPGMIDSLGNQLHDSPHDLKGRLEEFWRLDKNKDAFITDADLAHLVKRPSNLDGEAFTKLDKNQDGAVGIREFCAGFHDQVHMKEPWYHHKYGYVYGHDIPNHVKDAKIGAVKKGTAEHKAMKAGVHPAQTQKKLDDAAKDKNMKELNEKAHEAEKLHHEKEEKEYAKNPELRAKHDALHHE